MKNRTFPLLALTLLTLFTLPPRFVDNLRGNTVALMAPFWQTLVSMKIFLQAPFDSFSASDEVQTKDQEIQRLLLENQLLGNELAYLKELVEEEHEIQNQLLDEAIARSLSKQELNRHQKELLDHFHLRLIHIPARVIYRPINAWNSSLWVDKGEADNRELNRMVIGKNSPVVIGTSVVGVVDYVGEKQSRIRLITDSHLNLSVRIQRGTRLLAKGELVGESKPLARSHRTVLKGTGFNYDFADEEGPARDLRTGEPLDKKGGALPLLQQSDLLVTTGLDGVFPPLLKVGTITKIFPLKEGDYAYDLEAESSSGDLNSLTLVFILPPI